jgi:glyoxalase family protein
MQLNGIHHVTAITGDARQNVDFHTGVLGLRLVAKTVNQDDTSAYHLFYADEDGSPGADLTFFEYPGAMPGTAGPGMVHRVVWRVASEEAIDFWERRLAGEGIATERTDEGLVFANPEGMGYGLVVRPDGDPPLIARHPEIAAEMALTGFDGVRMYSLRPSSSRQVLEDVMGAKAVADDVFELRGPTRGGTVTLDPAPDHRPIPGGGTVHHVAFAADNDDHPQWPEYLAGSGLHSTPVIDRYYFHSVYFREPGGILYEIADHGPGFTRGQTHETMGQKVILPPWLEAHREAIEARLTPIDDPRATWATA